MYHSVNITTDMRNALLSEVKVINTWDDWHLIPTSRPTISNPKLISNYVDVTGASGSIDLTTELTGFPIYSDREGSIEFYVENGYGEWTARRNEINNILHGQKVKLYLEDEMDYYYVGRISIDDWKSEKDRSTLTMQYRFEPFKYSAIDVGKPWEWDPFNFNNGIITDTVYSDLQGDGKLIHYQGTLLPAQPSYGIFTISDNSLTLRFTNNELGIDETLTLSPGSYTLYDFIFSNITGKNLVQLGLHGTGKLNISMHFRSL